MKRVSSGFGALTGLGSVGRAVLVAGALLVSQSAAVTAFAQGPAGHEAPAAHEPTRAELADAKKHYGEGDRKFKAGDFAGAEADFKAANSVKATAQVERYVGLCEDSLGHFQGAVEWYERFLAHVPEKMATQGDEIRKRTGEIKAMPGKVHIESKPPGATVMVDDKPLAAPTPADVDLAPGSHTIKLSEAGRLPTSKTVDVAFASTATVAVELDPEPQAAPPPPPPVVAAAPPPEPTPPPPPPAPRSKVPAYVTGGLAIAAAGVGTVFGIMTLGDKSDYDKHPTTSTADNGDTHALICDMAFGVALTFGVTSAVLFLTKDEPAPAAASSAAAARTASEKADKKNRITVTPAPLVGAHSGGASVLVRF